MRFSPLKIYLPSSDCLLLLSFLFAFRAFSFPINQFTNFINSKPTIEKLVFRMVSTKYVIPETKDNNTSRHFTLIYDPNGAFSLIEDGKTYLTNSPLVRFWGGYGDTYWRYFNKNDVITTRTLSSNGKRNTTDPYPTIEHALGIALDLLDLGIIDLGTNRLAWSGNTFQGLSRIGTQIYGELSFADNGSPSGMQLTYTRDGRSYRYQTRYEFAADRGLPSYFPSNVRIEYIGGPRPALISEYDVIEASFSERELEPANVSFDNLLAANSRHFFFSNDSTYAINSTGTGTVSLERVRKASEYSPGIGRRLVFAGLFLALSAGFALLLLIQRTQQKQ